MLTKVVKASELGVDWRAESHVRRQAPHVYYPEMGERPDRARLFQRASHVGRFTFVDWEPARDDEARAVIRRLRVRPRIDEAVLLDGRRKFTAQLTGDACRKLSDEGDVSIEALLD
jgi:hypothetical protein